MRLALVTILPMLVAAILVMAGGEEMARRETTTKTEADRDRLLDFSSAFTAEVHRLDALYLDHLGALGRATTNRSEDEVLCSAEDLAGVRTIRIFRQYGKDSTINVNSTGKLPEIELEGRKRPLNPNTAIVVDATLLNQPQPVASDWIPAKDGVHSVFYLKSSENELAVILIDTEEVRQRTFAYLTKWLPSPMTPILESGERVQIQMIGERVLAQSGLEHHGPASAVIPIRTSTADWQIMAWDGINIRSFHDPATLAIATTLSLALLGAGLFLYYQQKRTLRLAAARVSFVNRVSHELGTPLTNLSLNLDLAEEALSSRPQEARRRLRLVAEEIERLSRLVSNVLSFSRRERQILELKPIRCDPADIILRTIESFRPSLERRGIQIEASIPPSEESSIDPDALNQIIGNLISNVEKYASSGRMLRIGSSQNDGSLIVEVRDLGPGIPESHHEKIFAPFERVSDSANEGSSGTGLGLAIARDLASRMGGELNLISEPKGACFQLCIPSPPAMSIVSEDPSAA